jgi:hypothetical protein
MHHRSLSRLVLAAFAVAACATPRSAPESAGFSSERLARLTARMQAGRSCR